MARLSLIREPRMPGAEVNLIPVLLYEIQKIPFTKEDH